MEFALGLLATIAARKGDWKRATTLLSGSRQVSLEEERSIHPAYLSDAESLRRTEEQARQALSRQAFDDAWADGQAMDVPTLIRLATGADGGTPTAHR